MALDQESATEGLPIARSYEQDTEVPIRTAIERSVPREVREKAKAPSQPVPASRPKAHELPLWAWIALGTSGIVILLLLGKILFG